ncbi:MAG: hypothetical protein KDJ47_08485 [Hyphomicrobiaceae bacterium]|nr:hypothetical protein [Hyphomicrobiaceae bacterium]
MDSKRPVVRDFRLFVDGVPRSRRVQRVEEAVFTTGLRRFNEGSAEREALRQAILSGEHFMDIAKRFDVDNFTVLHWRDKFGLNPKRPQ